MTRVVIYAREQISGDGFPRQIEACQQFIDSKGWNTARTFQETQNGADDFSGRKQFFEALNLADGVMYIKIIVVERAERIANDLVTQEILLRECGNKKIAVFVTDSGEELVSSKDPTRTLIRQIMGSLEKWEKSIRVRGLQAGRRAKAEKTGKFGGGGPTVDRYGNRGGVAQKNLERRIIGTILHWRKCGEDFTTIAQRLTSRRIKIPNPAPYHKKGVVARSPFFWTRDIVRGLYDKWVNTGTIISFVGNHL